VRLGRYAKWEGKQSLHSLGTAMLPVKFAQDMGEIALGIGEAQHPARKFTEILTETLEG
jgi:hypothetical protein